MKQQIFLPLETLPGTSIVGYVDTRDIRMSLGKGRSLSSDMFYAAWQNAANRAVSSKAISIRGGRETQGIYRLDSATVVETDEPERIGRRIRQREVVIKTAADLRNLAVTLTVTVNDGDRPYVLVMDDEACEEVDQRMRQMQMLLESYENATERTERIAEETASATKSAAVAEQAAVDLRVAAE